MAAQYSTGRASARTAAIFSQPVRQILAMVTVLVLVGAGVYVALPRVMPVFLSNPFLNGFIVLVFFVGVAACFWQALQLVACVTWIEGFAEDDPGHDMARAPRLLRPLAALLSQRRRMRIGASSARSILDSVATRIDEARDITRYIVNLLIFLGLLGTFYGLATTVPAIVETIRALTPSGGEDGMAVFGRLMDGLQSQLGGMGVAFASSLLGLAGSLVVGLLELFAGHSQNRFYRELEEWLSSITRLGIAGAEGEGAGEGTDGAFPAYISEQIDRIEQIFLASEATRLKVDARLGDLVQSLDRLSERMEREEVLQSSMTRVADGQDRLADALDGGAGIDAESRMRLRSIDVQLLRLFEEIAAGRHESTAELRQELRQISRALSRTGAPGHPTTRPELYERRG